MACKTREMGTEAQSAKITLSDVLSGEKVEMVNEGIPNALRAVSSMEMARRRASDQLVMGGEMRIV